MMMMTTTTTLSKAYEWMLVGTENIHELAAAIEVWPNALITFFSSSRSMVPSPFLSNSWKAFLSSSSSCSKLFRFLAIISQNSENSSFPLSFAVTETRNNDHSVNKKSLWARNKKNYASPEFSKGVPVQLIIFLKFCCCSRTLSDSANSTSLSIYQQLERHSLQQIISKHYNHYQ